MKSSLLWTWLVCLLLVLVDLDLDCSASMFVNVVSKLVNSNLGWESLFPVFVASRLAARPSKQIAKAATEHKQEVSSHNINFSLQACFWENPRVGLNVGLATRMGPFAMSAFRSDLLGGRWSGGGATYSCSKELEIDVSGLPIRRGSVPSLLPFRTLDYRIQTQTFTWDRVPQFLPAAKPTGL